MNRSDLVQLLSDRFSQLTQGDAETAVSTILEAMNSALEKFIIEQLTAIPGIEKIRSSFALKQVRYKTALPLSASAR